MERREGEGRARTTVSEMFQGPGGREVWVWQEVVSGKAGRTLTASKSISSFFFLLLP